MQKSFEDYLGLFGDTENNRQILITALEENAFDSFTSEQQETLYLKIIQELQEPLQRIPEKNRTSAISRAALQNDLEINLADVPDLFFQTEHPDQTYFVHQAENFIRQQGDAIRLEHLPSSQRTLHCCVIALRRDYRQMKYIPELSFDKPEFNELKKTIRTLWIKYNNQIDIPLPAGIVDRAFAETLLTLNPALYKRLPLTFRGFNQLLIVAQTASQAVFLDCLNDKASFELLFESDLQKLLLAFINSQKTVIITGHFCREISKLAINPSKEVVEALLHNNGRLIKRIQIHFSYLFNPTELDHFRRLAVQQDGTALKHLAEIDKTDEICITAILNNIDSLAHLPSRLKNYEFYKKIISKEPTAVLNIDPNTITQDQLQALHLLAIKNEPTIISAINITYINYDLISKCIQKKLCFLSHFEAHPQFSEIVLTEKQYISLSERSFEQDVSIIRHIPPERLTQQHFEKAAQRSGITLEFFCKNENFLALNETTQIAIYTLAVRSNPMALEFVPEQHQSTLINKIGMNQIMQKNGSAFEFYSNDEENSFGMVDFLKNLEHIIFTNQPDEREITDTITAYSNHPKRLGKTAHFSKFTTLEFILEGIKRNPSSYKKPLNLVLLSHADSNAFSVCGLDPNNIAELVKKYPLVSRITLLGCKTAQAKPFHEEIILAENLPKIPSYRPCGLILMSSPPDPNQYEKYLKKTKIDTNGKASDEVLILEKNETTYFLHHLKRSENGININTKKIDDPSKFTKIQTVLAGAKQLPFPGSGKNPNYYRGGAAAEFLTSQQLTEFRKILYVDISHCERDHPDYSQQKLILPILRSHAVTEHERSHLNDSLLLKVVQAIEINTDRSVEVKGYLHLMSVDTEKGGMLGSHEYIYTNQYKNCQSTTTFFPPGAQSIDRHALSNSRSTARLAQSEPTLRETPNSGFKSIIVTTKI